VTYSEFKNVFSLYNQSGFCIISNTLVTKSNYRKIIVGDVSNILLINFSDRRYQILTLINDTFSNKRNISIHSMPFNLQITVKTNESTAQFHYRVVEHLYL